MYLSITQIAQVAQLYVISFKYIAKNVHHFRASCYLLRILMVLKMWKHNYEHLENGTPCFISCTVHIWCHTMFCAPHFNTSREIQRMSVAKQFLSRSHAWILCNRSCLAWWRQSQMQICAIKSYEEELRSLCYIYFCL